MGTSTCHIHLGDEERIVPGMCGVVEDGVLPGFMGYEAGQSCVGDHFNWFVENLACADYEREAKERGLSLHQLLTEKAEKLAVGESGLVALDWWNGNRSVLVDVDLTGNRFVAHHVGLSGDPLPGLHYRLLYTHMKNWGTYNNPYEDVRYDDSFLAEASYDFAHVPALKGWRIGAAFALDRGSHIGDNTGFQLTLSRSGLLLR